MAQEDPLRMAFEPIRLPCGREVQNRFVKVSMYEHLAPMWGGLLNELHHALYSTWSRGEWGMILTGNVQVSRTHLSLGRDIILPEAITPETIAPFKRLANVIHGFTEDGIQKDMFQSLAIIQLSHGGLQSPSLLGGRPLGAPALGPSAIRVGNESFKTDGILTRIVNRMLFPVPTEMTISDIDAVVDMFVHGAEVAMASGFDGIQLHAAHGYLLSEFISLKYNKRQDNYSSTTSPLRLIHRIATRVREMAPKEFVIGIKLNAADYIDPYAAHDATARTKQDHEDRSLNHVTEIASWGMIDFIEVSGGDYESPDFLGVSRQALFSRFSRRAVKAVSAEGLGSQSPPLIVLTGGLRHPATFISAIADNHAHLLGFGRLSVICPNLPLQVKAQGMKFVPPPEPDLAETNVDRVLSLLGRLSGLALPKLIGAGRQVAWYNVQIRRLALGREPDYGISGLEGIVKFLFQRLPSLNSDLEAERGSSGSWLFVVILLLLTLAAIGTEVVRHA